MAEKKPKYREVTLYVREDETLQEYMEKARDGFYAEDEYRKLMSGPLVPFEEVLRELGAIESKETETLTKKKPGASRPPRTKQQR